MTTPAQTTAAAPAADTSTAAPAAAPATAEGPAAGGPDDFDGAFASLNADTPEGGAAPEPTPAPTPAPTTAPVAASTDDGAAPAGGAPAGDGAAPAAPAASPEVAALQQQIADLTAKVAAAPQPTPAPTSAPVEVPLYSTEEQAVLEKHKTDWSEVAAGEALVRRAEYRQLVSYIFGQIGPRLEELSQSTQTVSTRTQYTAIKELVPDYDDVRDATLEWVDKQPEYLKDAYTRVAETGAPADVADLITRFKKETGWKVKAAAAPAAAGAPAAPVATPAPTAAPATTALSAEAQAAVASLRPVTSGRTEVPNPADPNDFDAAFKEFAGAAH